MAIPLSLKKLLQPAILISDETRAYVLIILAKNKKGLCVQDLATKVGVSHSAMCHQLAKLERLKMVSGTRDGQSVIYSLTKAPQTAQVVSLLKALRAL
ncbi:MAG: winged helix-turn-helix transcriptional regulator [Candidatus Pacebacteria bacterium]|nr:winged helix-turn-helix transcriptional regulator [Candidatus Paceibacterota bacterium]